MNWIGSRSVGALRHPTLPLFVSLTPIFRIRGCRAFDVCQFVCRAVAFNVDINTNRRLRGPANLRQLGIVANFTALWRSPSAAQPSQNDEAEESQKAISEISPYFAVHAQTPVPARRLAPGRLICANTGTRPHVFPVRVLYFVSRPTKREPVFRRKYALRREITPERIRFYLGFRRAEVHRSGALPIGINPWYKLCP